MTHNPVTFLTEEQLHAMARQNIKERLEHLLADASELGLVVTVSQAPLLPLAMRNYRTVFEIRRRR